MSKYEELYNTIRRRLTEVKEVSDTINVEKLIDFMSKEEVKVLYDEATENDLPF